LSKKKYIEFLEKNIKINDAKLFEIVYKTIVCINIKKLWVIIVHELNILDMFLGAGLVVKMVMLLLLGFSFTSWYIVILKHFTYKRSRWETETFLEDFWKSKNLADANKSAKALTVCPESIVFRTGYLELQKLGKSRVDHTRDDITMEMRMAGMTNLQRALRKSEINAIARLEKSLPFLATTGSTTPFVGLFGTVWGIMVSFQQIGQTGSASLAVVAPGISEALVATAAGLAVAIPAVVFYNFYSSRLGQIENNMHNFSSDFLNLVERDFISR
jgi:biopolymer transport protein TolQ